MPKLKKKPLNKREAKRLAALAKASRANREARKRARSARIAGTDNPILQAIYEGEGLAAVISTELGISREAVWKWRQVPEQHARKVARICGEPLHRVRPDLYPLRKKAA